MRHHLLVRPDSYHDSVLLMRISRELMTLDGVEDAVVAMGTPQNRELLEEGGYDATELAKAGPNDLLVAVRGDGLDLEAFEAEVDAALKADVSGTEEVVRPTSLGSALAQVPEANLVMISLPGEHAPREARRALARGRHVMLFSDNVSVEDEISLKQEAVEAGLLMMGPDCGTAILNGKPLAFANVVRRGPIGVVGASGTGVQEITACIHRLGGGVSQAIGTGGRDLSDAVGGLMSLQGIAALAADPATEVLVVVSKPPSPGVAEKVVAALKEAPKPCVVHFVGAEERKDDESNQLYFASTLAGAAERACRLAGQAVDEFDPRSDAALVDELVEKLPSGASLCGLFCGGTTGHEALVILEREGLEIRSNLHKKGPRRVDGTDPVPGHVVLDMGDDVFTQGRPHPMIEPALRNERLAIEIADASVGLLLFDVVLGYGSHEDPAGLLAEGVVAARAACPGRELVALASVTGTDQDPQDFREQVRALEKAGIVVLPDNRRAALVAAEIMRRAER